jgi:hypothetical protein
MLAARNPVAPDVPVERRRVIVLKLFVLRVEVRFEKKSWTPPS